MTETVLSVENLRVSFPVRLGGSLLRPASASLLAVDGVSFDMHAGETLGVVGESGCGKSTLARAILRLVEPNAGRVVWLGESLNELDRRAMDAKRRELQIVFQDPLSSLNPRMTIGDSIREPLQLFHPEMGKAAQVSAVLGMMREVGLDSRLLNRYPNEFSGGQCQRVGIARAMILQPRLLVCDEPVSALDVSTQAQIIMLLKRLQKDSGMAILFISHDLSVVRMLCRRILVMYLGRLVEIAGRDELFSDARHPYTQALMSAVLEPDPDSCGGTPMVLQGEVPSALDPPRGCVFHTRCPRATRRCEREAPLMREVSPTHGAACHYADDEIPRDDKTE